ncbi:uncharacterized protein VP01_1050g9 [Puccinia sorghi]|uniref:OTU domain-containing protein n=1 Tax=Puccinia sorghi TaxID=27349 RepID=A0A0L6VVJ6_9BASI|nr:uncharacterized protein VP01_1050g9 [Puccinia sorghi]
MELHNAFGCLRDLLSFLSNLRLITSGVPIESPRFLSLKTGRPYATLDLTNVFPESKTHLCAWHIKKNIMTNFKRKFPSGEQFIELWNSMTHSKNQPASLEYLEKNSIIYSIPIISLEIPVDHQISHIHEGIGKNSIKTLTKITCSSLCLPQNVSKHAILKAQNQFNILEKEDLTVPCSHTLNKGSGIPCSHIIGEKLWECVLFIFFSLSFHVQDNTPEFYLKEEIYPLRWILKKKTLKWLPQLFEQFHQLLEGTHIATRIQGKKNQGKASTQERSIKSNQALKILSQNRRKNLMKKMGNLVVMRKKRMMGIKKIQMGEAPWSFNRWKKIQRKKRHFILKPQFAFQTHFHDIFNLDGDGNCVFRCILAARWGTNSVSTQSYLEAKKMSKNHISQLKVSRINIKIPPLKWLRKMDQGKAIANTFQKPVWVLPLLKATIQSKPIPTSLAQKNCLLKSQAVGGQSSRITSHSKTSTSIPILFFIFCVYFYFIIHIFIFLFYCIYSSISCSLFFTFLVYIFSCFSISLFFK